MATSARKAAPDPKKLTKKQRFWREVRGYAEALVIAFLVVTFLFTTVGVVGSSMQPSLDGGSGRIPESLITGDRVFIPKYDTWLRRAGILGPYQRGEIVVVREPANAPSAQLRTRRPFFIKRIIGLPGDKIKIVEGQVYVNGHPIDQNFITASGEIIPDPVNFPVITVQDGEVVGFLGLSPNTSRLTATGRQPAPVTHPNVQLFYGSTIAALAPIPADAPEGVQFVHELIVPEGHYFILGDNRQAARGGSEDSRYFGPIRAITVAGRANAVIWPPMRDGEWNWRRLGPPEAFAAIPDPQ